jgi:hypothetical protein
MFLGKRNNYLQFIRAKILLYAKCTICDGDLKKRKTRLAIVALLTQQWYAQLS